MRMPAAQSGPFGGRAWRRFRRNRAAAASAAGLTIIAAACAAGATAWRDRAARADLSRARTPPSRVDPFGTDLLGRSLAVRCVVGGAVSMGVGLSAAVFAVVLGLAWGSLAALGGGRIDAAMMRVVDIIYGLPYLLIAILLKVGLDGLLRTQAGLSAGGSEVAVLILAIAGVSWLTMARIVRAAVLSLNAQPFVEAARALGASPWRVWRAHILPNLAGPVAVYATLTVPQAMLQESFLSFLGLGIQPPLPSWGTLAAEGVAAINPVESFWWMLAFPCGLLSLTLLGLNFLGEGLRDALDPRG